MSNQKIKAGKSPAGDHISHDVLKADKIPLHVSYIHTGFNDTWGLEKGAIEDRPFCYISHQSDTSGYKNQSGALTFQMKF